MKKCAQLKYLHTDGNASIFLYYLKKSFALEIVGIMTQMIPVCIQTLIVSQAPNPCILVLCPEEDLDKKGVRRILPIVIGVPEAAKISFALKDVHMERPTTHDLYMDTLTNLDAIIHKAEITHVEDKTFFARLYIRSGERIFDLDARPSDAIALAYRQNAPLYVSEQVLFLKAIEYDFHDEINEKKEMAEFHNFIENLNPEDFLTEEDGE